MLQLVPLTVLRAVGTLAATTAIAASIAVVSSAQGADGPPAQRGRAITGQVQDTEGRPIVGATVYLTADSAYRKTTDETGKFDFTEEEAAMLLDKAEAAGLVRGVEVVATAQGYGIDWAEIGQEGEPTSGANGEGITLQLPRDMPIRGQLVGPDGLPIAGATVELGQILVLPGNDLSGWLQSWETSIANRWFHMAKRAEKRFTPVWRRLPFPEPWMREPRTLVAVATTDQEGRFEMRGVGRERAVWLRAKHPEFMDSIFFVVTRDDVKISPANADLPPLHPASFVQALDPAKFIEGVVRDARTGKPLAGVLVEANNGTEAATKADGSFRLGGRGSLRIFPSERQPYLQRAITTRGEQGEGDHPLEIELFPGVVVQGRVINGPTGEPVRRVELEYIPSPDNAQVTQVEGFFESTFGSFDDRFLTDPSGQFSVAVPSGAGLIAVKERPGGKSGYQRCTAEDFGYSADKDGSFTSVDGRRINPAEYCAVARFNATEGQPITGTVIEVSPSSGDEKDRSRNAQNHTEKR